MRSRADLKKALALKPAYEEAYNSLGLYYQDSGNTPAAIVAFKKAVEIEPDYVIAHNNLGNALKTGGRLEEAVLSYRKAIELKPDFALTEHQKAVELKPDFAEPHVYLAAIYFAETEFDLAVKHCDRARELGFEVNREFLESLEPYRK
ncbi:MAG: tetratricopeptide repeat protein [bacterium]|nr:tetratricopeptide repeat protein [bacterium]